MNCSVPKTWGDGVAVVQVGDDALDDVIQARHKPPQVMMAAVTGAGLKKIFFWRAASCLKS